MATYSDLPENDSAPGDPAPDAPLPPAPVRTPSKRSPLDQVRNTRTARAWTGLIVGAMILVLLLVFIVQNSESTRLNVFIWEWNMPQGVAILFAAMVGALSTALIGGARIFQIRRAAKRPSRLKSPS